MTTTFFKVGDKVCRVRGIDDPRYGMKRGDQYTVTKLREHAGRERSVWSDFLRAHLGGGNKVQPLARAYHA